jgi:SAM-dependent methyltransferase
MGTSNWQSISLCCEIIRRIRPASVLDIGCGFGRWGFLSRELLDVWDGRTYRNNWKIRIDAVEIFEQYITPLHYHIYDNIYVENVLSILPNLDTYELIIVGDLLEHFEKEQAVRFLEIVQKKAKKAVLLIVPLGNYWPQQEMNGNIWEAHRSVWMRSEFKNSDLDTKTFLFWDYIERPFAVVLYSLAPERSYKRSWKELLRSFVRRFRYRIKGF